MSEKKNKESYYCVTLLFSNIETGNQRLISVVMFGLSLKEVLGGAIEATKKEFETHIMNNYVISKIPKNIPKKT